MSLTLIGINEFSKEKHNPTPVSLLTNFMPLALAASTGLLGYRYKNRASFMSLKREQLSQLSSHVANVNAVLNDKLLDIENNEFLLINAQHHHVQNPGSDVDSAIETVIAKEFYNSYQANMEEYKALKQSGSSKLNVPYYQKASSNNLLGSGLHTFFGIFKSAVYNIGNAGLINEDELPAINDMRHNKRQEILEEIEHLLTDMKNKDNLNSASKVFNEGLRPVFEKYDSPKNTF